MKESVDYAVDVEDRATKKFRKAQEQLKQNVREVKEFGGQGKQSMDLLAATANSLGDGPLASLAGQFATLTDQITQYTESALEAGQASHKMKAGVIAATGAVSLFVGYEIGKELWGLQEQIDAVNRSFDRMADLAGDLATNKGFQLANQRASIDLIDDAAARQEALERFKQQMMNEVESTRSSLAAQQAEIDARERSWWSTVSEDYVKQTEMLKVNLEGNKQLLEVYKSQRDALIEQTSAAKRKLEFDQKQQAAEQKSDAILDQLRDARDLAEAANQSEMDRLYLMFKQQGVQQNMLEIAVGMEMQRQAAVDKRLADERKAQELEKRKEEIQRQALRDRKANITEVIKQEQARLDALKQAKDQLDQQSQSTLGGTVQAGESQRLLTGRSAAGFQKTAETIELERQTEYLKRQQEIQQSMDQTLSRIEKLQQQLEVVGD